MQYHNRKRSKDVIVVEDDKPAATMTDQAGVSCHDRMKGLFQCTYMYIDTHTCMTIFLPLYRICRVFDGCLFLPATNFTGLD